jgi:hypothetical protein
MRRERERLPAVTNTTSSDSSKRCAIQPCGLPPATIPDAGSGRSTRSAAIEPLNWPEKMRPRVAGTNSQTVVGSARVSSSDGRDGAGDSGISAGSTGGSIKAFLSKEGGDKQANF